MDQGRNVRRIGITVAHEAFASWRFINDSLECPTARRLFTELFYDFGVNAVAAFPSSEADETRVRDIPSSVENLQITAFYGKSIGS
jgi:hypothetical protein